MQIVINNERRPTKEGLYFTEDTVGNKYITKFRDGNWQSQTGHPVEKWIDPEKPTFTIEDMKACWFACDELHSERSGCILPKKYFEDFIKEKFKIES